MLDVKILSAVFASLVAAAVMGNGGAMEYDDINVDGIEEVESGFDFQKLTEDPIDVIRDHFRSYPEPENEFKANLTVENLHQQNINLRETGTLEVEGLKDVDIGANHVSSENKILLHKFRGSLDTGNSTTIEGGVGALTSSNVNISGTMSVNEEVNATYLKPQDVERTPLTFTDVGGRIESSDASTEFGQGSRVLEINSFSGDMTLYLENETILLDGRVDKLEAGSFSFGS